MRGGDEAALGSRRTRNRMAGRWTMNANSPEISQRRRFLSHHPLPPTHLEIPHTLEALRLPATSSAQASQLQLIWSSLFAYLSCASLRWRRACSRHSSRGGYRRSIGGLVNEPKVPAFLVLAKFRLLEHDAKSRGTQLNCLFIYKSLS